MHFRTSKRLGRFNRARKVAAYYEVSSLYGYKRLFWGRTHNP